MIFYNKKIHCTSLYQSILFYTEYYQLNVRTQEYCHFKTIYSNTMSNITVYVDKTDLPLLVISTTCVDK